jgi:hypothetical protein
MHTKILNILSIIPGTKYLGVAIFVDSDLRDWLIKSIPEISMEGKADYIRSCIADIIERFNINVLAIKKLHPARQSKNLVDLVTVIQETGKRANASVIEFPIHVIEQFFIKGKLNKKRLVEEVAAMYPVVFHEYEREQKNKNKYLTRMFEAIAMGIVCFNRLDKGHKKSSHNETINEFTYE